MEAVILLLIGIFIFIPITLFVHKHTYKEGIVWDRSTREYVKKKGRYTHPLWLVLVVILLLLTPYLNVAAFFIGTVLWFTAFTCKGLTFDKPSYLSKILDFLNKPV